MSHIKWTVGILLLGTAIAPSNLYAQAPNAEKGAADAKAVLAKVRDKLKSLKSYHFERKTTIREAKAGGEPTLVADLTFITIADFPANSTQAKDAPQTPGTVPLPIPYREGRFRFELKTPDGDFLQVGDGTSGYLYSSAHKMYRRGDTLWSLSESILGPVLANAHLFPFMALTEGATEDARLVREEEIEVGKERRKCIVITVRVPNPDISGMMKKALDAGKEGKAAANASALEKEMPKAFIAAGWNFSKLRSFGYLGTKMPATYNASATKEKQFTDVTLWIDKEKMLLVRAEFRESAQKVADLVVLSLPAGEVELQVSEQFMVAEIDTKLKDDLFTFVPPPDAKEVGKKGDGDGGPSWKHWAGGGSYSTRAPDLNEDGTQVVYSIPKTGHGDVYLHDIKTKQTKRLTKSEDTEISPSFRPKHQEVVFVREGGRSTHIWLLDLATGKERELTRGPGHDQIWDLSPDGKYLTFSRYLPAASGGKEESHFLEIDTGKTSERPKDLSGQSRATGETFKSHGKDYLVQAMDHKGEYLVVSEVRDNTKEYQINADLFLWNLKTEERESIGTGHTVGMFDNGKLLFFTGYERDAWIWKHGEKARKLASYPPVDGISSRIVGNRAAVSTIYSITTPRDEVFLFDAEMEKFEPVKWSEPAQDEK
jgi:outer membrane lipoprotein-sorting protein